jgi:hypothetical protein
VGARKSTAARVFTATLNINLYKFTKLFPSQRQSEELDTFRKKSLT